MKPEFFSLRTKQGWVGSERFFEDFELNFPLGSVTAILGASGVGKSTLLKAVAGLLPHTSLRVNWPSGQSFSRIALMAQHDLLMPWLSVLENVLIGYRLRGELKLEHRLQALDLLEKVGLKKWINAKPYTLSGGMRQRVALVRTFLEDAPLILMDEPFSALDLVNRHLLQNLAAELFKNKTVIMVTHDPKEALRLADKIFVLGKFPAEICYELNLEASSPIPRAADSSELLKFEPELINYLLKSTVTEMTEVTETGEEK